MGEDGEVLKYLALSREYLDSAHAVARAGANTPARFLAVHALELAGKAALARAVGEVPRTHNVGGEFGKHYRDEVGPEVTRRVNKLLDDYDAARYPDWEPPAPDRLTSDLAFIEKFLTEIVPRLGGASSA